MCGYVSIVRRTNNTATIASVFFLSDYSRMVAGVWHRGGVDRVKAIYMAWLPQMSAAIGVKIINEE